MKKQKYNFILVTSLIALSFLVVMPAFAQSENNGAGRGMMGRGGQAPVVIGTVTAINGNNLTVSGTQGFKRGTAAITFTVDATNAKITKGKTAGTISSIVVGDAVVVQGTVSGSNVTATSIRDGVVAGEARNGMGINGTVASISGTTLTVTGNVGPKGGTATTYTVDASGASVVKNGTASTVSVIIVGDKVMVQGTVTGTNVIAKNIRDGVPQPQIQGNGQPIVAGKVTAISGSTITITNTSNVTYTIDATSAKFVVGGVASPTISNIAVGNNVVVQGTVNGNSVIASSIIDQKAKTTVGEVSPGSPKSEKGMGGFMKGVGDFFKHMFGF